MRSVAEAIAQLCADARPVTGSERVPLDEALGRVLAEPVLAAIDVPPADNSSMDGYAFNAADWKDASTPLPLGGRIAAGAAPGQLPAGTAVRIFTGAEVPAGADTVVMQEHCEASGEAVLIKRCPPSGTNVRPRGQDMRRGQQVLAAGMRLRPQALGLLASLGQATVPVRRRLRVAVLSNGDELREPGDPLAPGQIYNSNRPMLLALLRDLGVQPVDLGVIPDDPQAIQRTLVIAADRSDVILSSGGVSVGEEDHVKAVVEQLGALNLWKIAMKPGKPLAYGRVAETPFIGLPGNPASALVTCLVIARPFLQACQGMAIAADTEARAPRVPVAFSQAGGPRAVYHRVRLSDGALELYPNQSSGVLLSACWAGGLAVQAPEQDLAPGDAVPYLAFSALN